jgi:hypothetical protein
MKLILSIIFLTLFSCSAFAGSSPVEYRAVLRTLPSNLNPRLVHVNVHDFVLSHIYFPLFERQRGNAIHSEFLNMETTRATSSDFTSYELCLKTGIRFADGSEIKQDDLVLSLADSFEFIGLKGAHVKAGGNSLCASVKLEVGDPEFFDRCRSYQCTVLKSATKQQEIPIGLGAFRVDITNSEVIELSRTNAGNDQLRKLYFFKFVSVAESINQKVNDYNHVYQIEIPQDIIASSREIRRSISKSYVVLVRIYDEKVRKRVSACLDGVALRTASKLPLAEIPGLLPVGFPGFSERFNLKAAHKECLSGKKKSAIPLYNYSEVMKPGLHDYFSKAGNKLPVRIIVKDVSSVEAVRKVYNSEEELIVIIGVEYMDVFSYGLFRDFVDGGVILKRPSKSMIKSILAVNESSDRAAMEVNYRAAHRALLDSGFVVPLGQFEAAQYYPRWVSDIQWLDSGAGYPRLDLVRVKK